MADFYKNCDLICDYPNERGAVGLSYHLGELEEEPVTIQDFKDHAKIDWDTDDNLISIYLVSAREAVEQILRKSLGVRTVEIFAEHLPDRFKLDWGNYAADASLFGKDILKEGGNDLELSLETENTVLNSNIKNAILMQAFDYYERRGVYSGGGTDEVMAILQPYRNIQFP